MPIRKPDGTNIEDIRKGDGTAISEVRTGDGTVVWTPAIPDSVVWQTPYDEGSGTTVADIIGSADGNVNGATWNSSQSAVGGEYLSFDGDDNVDYGTPSVLDLDPKGSWTIEIAAKIQSGNAGTLFSKGVSNSSERQYQLYVDGSSGNYALRVGGVSITSNTSPSGSWDVVHAVNDGGSIQIYVDGSSDASGTSGTSTNSGQTVYAGARTDGSSFELTGDLDSPVIHDEALSSSVISDRVSEYPDWT